MTNMFKSIAEFETMARANGFDTVLERVWEPNQVVPEHAHPFDVHALVVAGDYTLTVNQTTQHYKAGDTFEVARNQLHAEVYGPAGCTFWVARRH
jgi:hypothetical protein